MIFNNKRTIKDIIFIFGIHAVGVNMDVLVNYMDKMTIHVSSLTIEYYVLKKERI